MKIEIKINKLDGKVTSVKVGDRVYFRVSGEPIMRLVHWLYSGHWCSSSVGATGMWYLADRSERGQGLVVIVVAIAIVALVAILGGSGLAGLLALLTGGNGCSVVAC